MDKVRTEEYSVIFKITAVVSLSLLFITLIPVQLRAQALPGSSVNIQEKRPSPQDPSYKPPLIPPSLRSSLDTMNPAMMLDPSQMNLENLQKAREKDAIKKRKRQDRKLELELREIPDDNERAILERSILNQFGEDQMPEYASKHDPYYTETGLRRFQIIYFLSLPFTMAGTYGVFRAAKASSGQNPRIYDGPTTAAMVSIGLILSGIIAYYDHRMWKKEMSPPPAEENALFEEDRKRTELEAILSYKVHRVRYTENPVVNFSFSSSF
jgi:hypothetical protein